jgi:hypothetical protein
MAAAMIPTKTVMIADHIGEQKKAPSVPGLSRLANEGWSRMGGIL